MANPNGVKKVKLTDIMPDKRNANLHSERGVYMVNTSLSKLGAGRSILVDKDNEVIAGNLTLEQAIDAGFEDGLLVKTDGHTLVVVQREDMDLDDPQTGAREMAYVDNRSAEVSINFDPEEMKIDYEAGIDLGDYWQDFELEELGVIEPESVEDVLPQIDRAEELREKWGVESGQLWQLGDHRVICGDCTDESAFDTMMGGKMAGLIWTDPPYGVNYGDKLEAANPMGYRVREIQNDGLPPDELETLVRTSMQLCAKHSDVGSSIYVASPPGTPLPVLIASFVGSGFKFRWHLVWVKDQIVLSRADYHFKHENLLYGWKTDGVHYFTPDRTQSSVFEYERPKASEEHPTMKPIELVMHMVKNSSQPGWGVLDPFLGSGTTLIACERLNRKCYGIEIEPKYIAVTLQRWHDVTGREPVLIS